MNSSRFRCVLLSAAIVVLSTAIVRVDCAELFGPFKLFVDKVEKCARYKFNTNRVMMHVVELKNTSAGQEVLAGFEVLQDIGPLQGKFNIYKGKQKIFGISTPTNICDNVVIDNALKKYVTLADKCCIKKGNYSIKLDVEKITKDIIGKKFVYGTSVLRTEWFTASYKILCYSVTFTFSPI